MGKLSSTVDGKILDWRWKKRETDYLFFVGDHYVGQIFNLGRGGWAALHGTFNSIGLAEGFKSRYLASRFLLKHEEDLNIGLR
jgi:hydrogenase maturation factor